MKLGVQMRITAILVVVMVALVGALAGLQSFHRGQAEMLFKDRGRHLGGVLDRCIETDQRSYVVHVADYTRWDDMVKCVQRRDTRWADVYIKPSLAVFDVDVVWVLDPDLRTVYTTTRLPRAPTHPPTDTTTFLRDLAVDPFRHWFARTPDGVLEIWTAPIQPAADVERTSTPQGYYGVGRYWGEHVLGDLSTLVGGRATLWGLDEPPPPPRSSASAGVIDLDRRFADLQGHPVGTMRFTMHYPSFAAAEDDARHVRGMVLALVAVCVLVMIVSIHAWVVRPLRRIRSALRREDPSLLGEMHRIDDEFGRLAVLIREFFAQRDLMVREVAVRRAAERDAEAQREFVRQVLDTDPNAIYVVDGLGRVVFANEGAHALFGVERGTLPGRRIDDVLGPLGTAVSFHRSRALAMQTWEPQVVEEQVAAPDGLVRRLESVRCPLQRLDGETHVLTISLDLAGRFSRGPDPAPAAGGRGTPARAPDASTAGDAPDAAAA
jgi:PAS domain S-box-containing protein